MESSTPPSQLPVKTSYFGITSDQMVLTKTAMNELRSVLFHVTTADNNAGEAVVQYSSGQTDIQPTSCGAFVRMENDKWGPKNGSYSAAKWGDGFDQARSYDHLAWVYGSYHWTLDHRSYGQAKRWECDDYLVGVTTGDLRSRKYLCVDVCFIVTLIGCRRFKSTTSNVTAWCK